MNEFGQKGKVPLSERLAVSPEEASALTGTGLPLFARRSAAVISRPRSMAGAPSFFLMI
jgi:hypothetical protein